MSEQGEATLDGFGARLRATIEARGPVCVGIDPHQELLARWGLPDDADGLSRFSRTVIDALADRVAIFKPQVAFFERFGSRGVAVLEETIHRSRRAGALVLLDAKRADIGSTTAGYAAAYLNPTSPLSVDAVTANPYLGVAALTPMFSLARGHGGGVFVVARTSNPEGEPIQRARTADGRSVAQLVVDEISQLNEGVGAGSFGVVVGVGGDGHGLDLSRLGGPVLVPGLGAQGGTAADLRAGFAGLTGPVLPVSSRQVLAAGPDPAALRQAHQRLARECQQALTGA